LIGIFEVNVFCFALPSALCIIATNKNTHPYGGRPEVGGTVPRVKLIVTALCSAVVLTVFFSSESSAEFDDTGWIIKYQENFDTAFEATDGEKFGSDDWLVFQLINGGAITVADGYAWLNAHDFWNAALIRSADVLPNEYKIRTKIGYINYDLTNYEQVDLDDTNFNTHSGYYENGMYFLTITDDTCSVNQCEEIWWHYHRKMVIDVDNHVIPGPGEVLHPVYMVYMAPETNSGGNLLRTWDGAVWDESAWNWNVAYTYAYDTWYYAELEKKDNQIILRLYDANRNILEETPPVTLDKVFAMDVPDYLYLGEPHTDDYEGDVRIDEITLLEVDILSSVEDSPTDNTLPQKFAVSQNYPNPFNPQTTIKYHLSTRADVEIVVLNLLGQKVKSFNQGTQSVGGYDITWNGLDESGEPVASGVYFYRIRAGEFSSSKKMLLLK
jgi:hypothetical protein